MEIDNMIEDTLDNLRAVVNSSNIIGAPVYINDNAVVPLSRVTFGYLVGGGDISAQKSVDVDNYPYAGGSGGGVNITPIGLLMYNKDECKFIRLNKKDEENKWVELIEAGLKVVQDGKKS